MDLTRQGYYYHPLGDLAKELIDYTSDEEMVYVKDGNLENNIDPSGVGNVEWGTNTKIPGGVNVYAMATGIIYNIEIDERGIYLYLRTNKQDSSGDVICIKYSFLGGLSDTISNAVGITRGIIKKEELSTLSINTSIGFPINAGEQIGYTNNWDENCMLRISFIYRQTVENNSTNANEYINKLPHIDNIEEVNKKFSFTKLNDSLAKYSVKCNGKTVGTENGMSKLKNGAPSLYYPIYPFLSYLTLQQKPEYCETMGPEGGVPMLKINDILYYENMDQNALNFYLNGTMGTQWIGNYPNTIEDVNNNKNGLRYAVAICKRELNFDIFSGTSYAKLLRAKMIGEPWQSGNNMKEWFEGLNPSQFAGKSTWLSMEFSEEDLKYAQLVYMNLCYPNIYGSELFEGTQEFYNAIVYGCQQVPIYNLSPINYYPLAFVVNFNTTTNKDEGDHGGAGNFLMYRQRSGDMTGFNTKIQG